jgi:hypothetical protein
VGGNIGSILYSMIINENKGEMMKREKVGKEMGKK